MAPEGEHYQPKDAVKAALNGTMVTGGAGALVAAVQNSLSKKNVGAWGIFTRSGAVIGTFAAIGGTFQFTRLASANLREKDDSYNNALAGFFAGSIMGFRHGTTPAILGFGALTAIVMGAFDYTGGSLSGFKKDKDLDEFERKETLRKNRRRPIEETLSQLGEGRGIYGPGYDERRRERIKEKYGIDVVKS